MTGKASFSDQYYTEGLEKQAGPAPPPSRIPRPSRSGSTTSSLSGTTIVSAASTARWVDSVQASHPPRPAIARKTGPRVATAGVLSTADNSGSTQGVRHHETGIPRPSANPFSPSISPSSPSKRQYTPRKAANTGSKTVEKGRARAPFTGASNSLTQSRFPTAPPSSVTSLDSTSSSPMPDDDFIDEGIRPRLSWPQESPIRPEKTPGGGRHYRGDAKVISNLEYQKDIVQKVNELRRDRYGVLTLLEQQGCTFGYGDRFKVENGSDIYTDDAGDARRPEALQWNNRHLLSFGRNIEMVGTKGLYSCLGVYFAIEGNRVFCARINESVPPDRSYKKEDQVKRESQVEREVRSATIEKMQFHAKQYGWLPKDVAVSTIKFASSAAKWIAHVTAFGILEFLGILNPDQFLQERPIEKAHGFAITPGSSSFEKPRGVLCTKKPVPKSRRPTKPDWVPFPAAFEPFLFVDDHGRPMRDWYYTVGNENQWYPLHEIRHE